MISGVGLTSISIVQTIGILVAFFLLGFLVLRIFRENTGVSEVLGYAFPLGGGILSFVLFIISWIGFRLDAFSIALTYLCLSSIGIGFLQLRHKPVDDRRSQVENGQPAIRASGRLAIAVFFGLALIAGYLSVMRAYSSWDAIGIWGVKGYAIAREGTIQAAGEWGSHGLSYPLNIPLQIALFRIFGGDPLPGSKLIFTGYYLSLAIGIYAFLRAEVGTVPAFLGAMLVGTTPIIFEHATIGYANLPFTTYLVLGLVAVMESTKFRDEKRQILGGLFLGLASWTRPEGVFLIVPILAVLYWRIRSLHPVGRPGQRTWVFPAVLLIAAWQAFTVMNGSQGLLGEVLRSAWASLQRGDFHLEAVYWTARFAVRQLIEPKVWGLILPVGVLVLIASWRQVFSRENDALWFLVLPAAIAGLSLFAYYYLMSFEQDIQYLLGTSANRLFMPVWVAAFIGLVAAPGWATLQEH